MRHNAVAPVDAEPALAFDDLRARRPGASKTAIADESERNRPGWSGSSWSSDAGASPATVKPVASRASDSMATVRAKRR
jgi:hypothetical protein